MDLLSTVRKQGSRGGVNFSWDDVATSAHRENYLGHSLKAPVGRWAQGRDLTWYAKADSKDTDPNETEDERKARERREEIRKIKEAEEDAIAKALGLPVKVRETTGANAIEIPERKVADSNEDEQAKAAQFLRRGGEERDHRRENPDRKPRNSERHHRRHRSRSRDRGQDRKRGRDRSTDRERRRDRSRDRLRADREDGERHTERRRSRSREADSYRREQRLRPTSDVDMYSSRSKDHDKRKGRHRDRSRSRGQHRRQSREGRRSRSPV